MVGGEEVAIGYQRLLYCCKKMEIHLVDAQSNVQEPWVEEMLITFPAMLCLICINVKVLKFNVILH